MTEVLTTKDQLKWQKYLDRLPSSQQDVYFTPEYYSLYEKNGDGKACCFVFEEEGSVAIYPFMKNSVNLLGYQLDDEYNGMIVNSNDKAFIDKTWDAFDRYCDENHIVAEFTRFHPILKNKELGRGHFDVIFDRHTVYMDLAQTEEEIFKGFDKSTRQHVRKASKSIDIRPVQYTEDNVDIFNSIYRANMEHVHSIPYLFFSKEHFRRMFQMNDIEFFIAYQDDIPIACYSGLVSKDYYSNYLRASLTEYNKTGVNTLMYWSMIKSAKAHGCRFVHFGGGSNSNPDNSLLKYKMNFSKSLSDFHIGKKIHNATIYDEIVRQWMDKHPESYDVHRKMLLGYREI